MNLFYNNFKEYWVKAEMVCGGGGGGVSKVSPATASPIKILIMHIQEQNSEKAYLIAK